MTKKALAIENLLSGDPSGRLRRLHDQLVSIGLKTKMPSNSSTLLFECISTKGDRVGLAALRDADGNVFSFPKPYWKHHIAEVEKATSDIDHSYFIATEGLFSRNQYSVRQIRALVTTMPKLDIIVSELIFQHFRLITNIT